MLNRDKEMLTNLSVPSLELVDRPAGSTLGSTHFQSHRDFFLPSCIWHTLNTLPTTSTLAVDHGGSGWPLNRGIKRLLDSTGTLALCALALQPRTLHLELGPAY
jgi:hypothetical protein